MVVRGLFWLFSFFLLTTNLLSQGYTTVEDAIQIDENCFLITQDIDWQNGAVWYNDPIDISEPFDLQFLMSFGDDPAGADGMVFVMQQVGNNVIGEAGGGIGFEGFAPSIGVEFDTWSNFETEDPVFDHVALLRNGSSSHNPSNPNNLDGPYPITPDGEVEDGELYTINISWDPSLNSFSVLVNCVEVINYTVSLSTFIFPGNADIFWGFTGATGGESNEQFVCLDNFILGIPEEYTSCSGEPVQLEAPSTSQGTLTWDPAEFLDNANSPNPVATVTETTTFTLVYEDLCGNQQIDETTIVVEEPTINIGPDLSICPGEEVTLQADISFENIVWSTGDQGIFTTVSDPGEYFIDATLDGCPVSDTLEILANPVPEYSNDLDVLICEGDEFSLDIEVDIIGIEWFDGSQDLDRTFTQPGSYPFTISNGLCTSDSILVIDVLDITTFSLGADIAVCEGVDVLLDASGEFDSITWSDFSSENTLSVFSSGTYYVDVSLGSCQASDTVEVEFIDTPVYEGVESVELCEGEDYLFQLNNPTYSIEWFDGNTSPVRSFDQPGVFQFELSFQGCEGDFQFELIYTPIPAFNLGPDFTFCQGDQVFLNANVGGAEVLWNTGSSESSIPIPSPGTYWAVASINQCSFSDTVSVDILPTPSLILEGDTEICPEEQVTLFANTSSSVVWSTGEVENEIIVSEPGIYIAIATNELDCSAQESIEVEGFDIPEIETIRTVVKCLEDNFVEVNTRSTNDDNLIWSTGDVGASTRVEVIGEYNVTLSNICGADTVLFSVVEEECLDRFFMPNAFTPDGDGLNDIFKSMVGPHEEFEMRIYNRIGEEVFRTKQASQGWNGSFQNNEFFCPTGVYTVWYSVKFDEFTVLEDYGSVTLIR